MASVLLDDEVRVTLLLRDVCMYVHMCVMHVSADTCIYIICACMICICMSVDMYVYMWVYASICLYVCVLHVCMFVFMCMHCTHAHVCVYSRG